MTIEEVPDEDDRKIFRKSQIDGIGNERQHIKKIKEKYTQSLSDNAQTL